MGAILRRVPQVGENNFPLPWIPKSSPAGAVLSSALTENIATATAIGSQTSMLGGDDPNSTSIPTALVDSSSPATTASQSVNYGSSTHSSAGPTHTQITYGHGGHGASDKSLALAVTVPLGIALVLGIIAVVVLNRWRKPSRPRNNSSSTSSSKPIWREKFGLLRSNSTSTSSTSSSGSSIISGPISTASQNHPYYASHDPTSNTHQEQSTEVSRVEESRTASPRTEPGTVIFEAPPPPYIKEPAPELPNLPAGLARLSYQHPPPPPTRPVSELRISVQMANALRISAQSIGFPSLGSLPVSEIPPAHPPLPEDLGRWSYPHQQQAAQGQGQAQSHAQPASPEVDELRNSTLARFPVPPSIPAKSERRPYTPPLQNLTVPQMQKMQYRNTSPELTSPTSPESPVWGHGFPDHPIRPSHSVRSFTSTLYSDTASVHSAHAARLSARPTPVITQGQGYFGDLDRSASLPY